MNKNVIVITIVIVLVCAIGIGSFFLFGNKTDENKTRENDNDVNDTTKDENRDDKDHKTGASKILVVYYSATNNTKGVAEKIAKNLDADLFEIEPEKEYTSADLDWTDENSRVSKEHDDESLRNVKLKNANPDNWENYDTIIIGYPIWWGVAAWPVNTFVKSNDFEGKTIIPFATSASSGLGESGKLLEGIAKGRSWQQGRRFSSRPSDSDIKSFTDNIK